MKFFFRFACWSIVAAVFFWLLAWFTSLEPNIFNWGMGGRFFLVLMSVVAGGVVTCILEVNDEECEDEL